MTHGRQLGSTTTIVRPASRPTTASSAAASGSRTSPSVPTCSAATSQRQRGERRRGRQARRRRAGGVEAVARRARLVEAGEGERRRLVGALGRGQVDAVGAQHPLVGRAEAVGRQAPEVRHGLAQAPDRPRGVERATAGVAVDAAVGVRDEVVQRLAADEDRWRAHRASLRARQLAGAARDERRREDDLPRRPVGAVEAREEQLRRRAPEPGRVLGEDGQPRLDDVAEHDVVEADERDRAREPEVVQRPHGVDRDEVLAREDGGRRVVAEQQLARRLVRVGGARHRVAHERLIGSEAVARERRLEAAQALGRGVEVGAIAEEADARGARRRRGGRPRRRRRRRCRSGRRRRR